MSCDLPDLALITALQALHGTFLQPNILLLENTHLKRINDIQSLWQQCISIGLGIIHQVNIPPTIDPTDMIDVWIRPQSPDWDINMAQKVGNLDLTLLLAIQLSKERNIPIRLVTTLEDPKEHIAAENYLNGIMELGRLPMTTSALSFVGDIWYGLSQRPPTTVQIFGLPLHSESPNWALDFINNISERTTGLCLFVRASGQENLLA